MRKVFAESKILVLATAACAMGLLLGAGCPASDVLDPDAGLGGGTAGGPTFQFTAPTARVSVIEGQAIGLSWTDSHPAGDATIRLFYDHDGSANTGDETTITMVNEPAGTTSGGYAWDTTGMAMGVYRLGATIDDHTHAPVTRYSPYEVVVRERGTGGGPGGGNGGGSGGTDLMPTLTMLQPATELSPPVGSSIMLRWTVTNAPPQAKLYLYYDADKISNNLNEQLIAAVGPGAGQIGDNDYGWTIPTTLANGTYYILARLTDGLGTELSAYAPGSIVIGGGVASRAERDLSQVGLTFPGAIFDGAIRDARLGEVMTGGKDFNGDGYSDFILVAPKSYAPWKSSTRGPSNTGQAYLVFSRGQTGRWAQGIPISIGTIGTPGNVQGITFIGPAYSTTTSGIQEVIMIDDCDGDSRPEIVFGIPDVDRIVTDHQDYDPLDSDDIHPDASDPALYRYQADGWQTHSTPSPDDGHPSDDLRPEGGDGDNPGKRSGMIIYVSSRSPIANRTTLLDETGQVGTAVVLGNTRSVGMRLYPRPSSDTTGWGSQLAVCNLFASSVLPAMLVARPEAANGNGSVKILLQESMWQELRAWTAAPAFGWNTEPIAWTFPAADSTGGNDEDRMPRWPRALWYEFMDPFSPGSHVPDPTHFDIMNSDTSVAAGGHLGRPTNLRDFNGDRLEDLAVASPDANPDGRAQAGTAYIIYGASYLRGVDVSRFAQGLDLGFELAGTQPGEQLGWKMAGPGDLDGDRLNDWVLTAPNRDWAGRTDCGAVVIVYGQEGLLLRRTLDDVGAGLHGAVIYGANSGDQLGLYMADVGDVNRDGYPDLVVAAPGYDYPGDGDAAPRSDCGAVYLIYGGPHLVGDLDIADIGTPQLPGKVYVGPEAGARVGPVAAAGDTDGDYLYDFLIAYPGFSPSVSTQQAGRVWLIYGSSAQAP